MLILDTCKLEFISVGTRFVFTYLGIDVPVG